VTVLILGCGYTGERVARRFVARGARVIATTRNPARLAGLDAEIIDLAGVPRRLTPGALVLHSIPPGPAVIDLLGESPARVVYLSSTGVYGDAQIVNEMTPVVIETARLAEERRVAAGPWSSLVLRPAAIYGPGRGALATGLPGPRLASPERELSAEQGVHPPSIDNLVSRIHVDDLATHVEAALLSSVTGAYPVADEQPCTPREVAAFCSRLLDRPITPRPARSNRRVDGSAIRRVLGVTLKYPSYQAGYAAASSPAVK
jgi:nucleoside-diphosphate-sugar epimerase